MSSAPSNPDQLREHLEKVICSPVFAQSDRLKRFLRFSLDRTLAGETDQVKEAVIGVEVFDRPEGYDTKIDPIVRVEARRLRAKLDQYYESDGRGDPVRFALPKGSYALVIGPNTLSEPDDPMPEVLPPDTGRSTDLVEVRETGPLVTQTIRISRVPVALILLVGSVLGAVVALTYFSWSSDRPERAGQLRRVTTDSGLTSMPSVTADGKLMVYASDRDGKGNLALWLHPLPDGPPRRITADALDARDPSISPDGQKVAYRSEQSGGAIYELTLRGNTAPKLIGAGGGRPRYSPDGRWILYTVQDERDEQGRLFSVPSGGGTPAEIVPDFADAQDGIWSEDGTQVLFSGTQLSGDPEREHDWWLAGFRSRQARKTGVLPMLRYRGLSGAQAGAWKNGWVVFAAQRGAVTSLWRVRLSQGGRVESEPEQLTFGTSIDREPVVAGDNIYFASGSLNLDIWSVALDANSGRATGPLSQLTTHPAAETYPWLSADGERLAFASDRNDQRQIYWRQLDGGEERVLTTFSFTKDYPILSPDGQLAAFRSIEDPKMPIWVVELRSGSSRQMCSDCGAPTDWSPDGRYILYEPSATVAYIGRLDLEARRESTLISHTTMSLRGGRFSPAGRWIAFHAESGATRRQVFIAPYAEAPTTGASWIPVTDGSTTDYNPFWSPGGNLIYFISERDGFRGIWAQRLDSRTMARAGAPFPVLPVRTASRTLLRNARTRYTAIGPIVRNGRMVFTMDSSTFNIWVLPMP
jgi:Tol biopolymer transport system component